MAFLAVIDESADKEQKHIFAVAGFVAKRDEWLDLEKTWRSRLNSENPPIPYFRATECRSLSGAFARFRDPIAYPKPTGREAANRLRADLADILADAPVWGIGHGILMPDYRWMRRSSRARRVLRKSPYETAYQQVMVRIAQEVGTLPDAEPVAFLFDENTELANIKKMYKEIKGSNPNCGKWMASITDMDDKDSPALQAADMFVAVCKDAFMEVLTKSINRQARDELFGRWHHGGISYWDKHFMRKVVDASILRKGKPSIFSTIQPSLFGESLIVKATTGIG